MKKAILKQEVERTFGRQLTETRDFDSNFGEARSYEKSKGAGIMQG
jgi:hypothetical protein